MQKFVNIYKVAILIFLIVIVTTCGSYKYAISAVSKESKEITFEVKKNSTYLTIAEDLKSNGLIRSINFYKVYIKLFKPENLQTGKYVLNQNMDVKSIIAELSKGSNYNPDTIKITFKEGINMRSIASVIATNTNNTEEQVFSKLKDSNYLDSLIEKYWFIDSTVKDNRLYYSLEGYLYPDTYEYLNKDVSVEQIFSKMLDKMDSVLSNYKDLIKDSKYSVHELLTLSSIVELEGASSNDRNGIAGVFYNRLKANWSLGSDVTTYYAAKINMSDRDLNWSELNDVNDYNTRSQSMAGKLPIGPICIPSLNSIEAALKPTSHDYYYFVADINKKTYFNKTELEHNNTISRLRKENLWFTY